MKVLIIFGLLLLSVSSAPKGKGSESENESEDSSPEDEGVILTTVEVALTCTKGTQLGDKFEKAFNDCYEDDVEVNALAHQGGKGKGKEGKGGKGKEKAGKSGKGKGKAGKGKGKGGKGKEGKGKAGKGKGKGVTRCPSVVDVLEKLRSKSKRDACVFTSIGWLDEDGKAVKDVMEEEINSLPAEVASQMSLIVIETCANAKAKEWSQRPKRQRCDATYSKDERDELTKFEVNVASMKCVKIMMRDSCRIFISKPTAVETIPFPINNGNLPFDGIEILSPGGANPETVPIPISPGGSSSGAMGGSGPSPIFPGGINPETLPFPISPGGFPGGIHPEILPYPVYPGGFPGAINPETLPFPISPGGFPGVIHPETLPLPVYPGGFPGGINPETLPLPIYNGLNPESFPFPMFPKPFPSFGGDSPHGNIQQVLIQPPFLPERNPQQLLPQKWPSNLVAALVPADWVANNMQFQFGSSDDEYDYYEEYDYTDEYGDDYGEEYPDYYGEEYPDYYGEEYPDYYGEEYDDYYGENDVDEVTEKSPSLVVAVPLPLDLPDENATADERTVRHY